MLLDFVRQGNIVFVHSMDRMVRNLEDLRGIIKYLTGKGVQVKFIKENLTFSGEDTPLSTGSVASIFSLVTSFLLSEVLDIYWLLFGH
nr:recombinase family protein [Cardinium endosymbiont of Oedothorax gibbosus]